MPEFKPSEKIARSTTPQFYFPSHDTYYTPVAAPLKLLTVDEYLSLKAPEWLVEGLVVDGSFVVMFGAPGACKSFLGLEWAARIATGTATVGRPVQRGKSLYILGEGGRSFMKRIHAWLTHNGASADDLSLLRLFPATINITNDQDRHCLLDALKWWEQDSPEPLRFIVIDTLATCLGDGDENSAADMGRFVRGVRDLQTQFPHLSVLVIHHSGKKKQAQERGSTALRGAADNVIQLELTNNVVTVANIKQKDDESFTSFGLSKLLVTDDASGQGSLVLVPKDLQAIAPRGLVDQLAPVALRVLGGQPTAIARGKWRQLTESECGRTISDASFGRLIRKLLDHGWVNQPVGHNYAITPTGHSECLGVVGPVPEAVTTSTPLLRGVVGCAEEGRVEGV